MDIEFELYELIQKVSKLEKEVSQLKSKLDDSDWLTNLVACKMKGIQGDLNLYNAEQLYQLLLGKNCGVNISHHMNPNYDSAKMSIIRSMLVKGYDISPVDYHNLDCSQLVEIVAGLDARLDVNRFSNPSLSSKEMRKIRESLVEEKKGLEKPKLRNSTIF